MEIGHLKSEIIARNEGTFQLRDENIELKSNLLGYKNVQSLNDYKFFKGLPNIHMLIWVADLVTWVKTCLQSFPMDDYVITVFMKLVQ